MILRLFHGQASNRRFIIESNRRIQPGPERSTKPGSRREAYLATIEPVVAFLQGRDPMLALHLARRDFFLRPRFSADRRPGEGMHVCSWPMPPAIGNLYIEDLTDLLHETVAPHLFLNRYAEQIMEATSSFDRIEEAFITALSLTDNLLLEALEAQLARTTPDIVGPRYPSWKPLRGPAHCASDQDPTARHHGRDGRRLREHGTATIAGRSGISHTWIM